MEWATLPLKKYADFTGRARRKEYWSFFLLCLVGGVVIGIVEAILGLSGMIAGVYGPLTVLFALALLVPSLAVGVRRLHDTDKTGWLILLVLIPLIGAIILLVLYLIEGTRGPNQYGPDPKSAEAAGAAGVA